MNRNSMKLSMLSLLAVCLINSKVLSQSTTNSAEYNPSFSAIVVKNVDNSTTWYQSVLGLTVKEQMGDEKAGYKAIILESPSFTLELLELKGSLQRSDLLQNKPEGTQIQGHFKIGFKASSMDACLKKLESLKINVPQVWTDNKTKKRNFLITDPDGNLIQFFE